MAIRENALQRFFRGFTEQTFLVELGIGDPHVVDYLAKLLVRFVHIKECYRLQIAGKRLEEVAEMLMEAQQLPDGGRTQREFYRHIGDFTLFWTGLYPEALKRLQSKFTKDYFIDYCEQGKRSYYKASTYEDAPYEQEAPILRRLSDEFELCAYGLNRVRKDWEKHAANLDEDLKHLMQ